MIVGSAVARHSDGCANYLMYAFDESSSNNRIAPTARNGAAT